MGRRKIVVTCEHAGNIIPKAYELLFLGNERLIGSHKGWDPGAHKLAKYMADHLQAPLFYQKISRLLVEVNRSVDHPELFSMLTDKLDDLVKQSILDAYYWPYRNKVEQTIDEMISIGHQVLHLSAHTFTPVLNRVRRKADIGILFDEECMEESEIAKQMVDFLSELLPDKVIRANYPYRGADDGFTTYLRTKFDGEDYSGIELEINQKYVGSTEMNRIRKALITCVASLNSFSSTVAT